jgi:ribosomal protein S12 methylthiotransferase
MRRGHGPQLLKHTINRIRAQLPSAFIRTAVLVAHPGETPSEFNALLELIEWARFDHLGAFRYSNEEGTASFAMPNPVSKRDAYNRFRKVMALQRRISRAKNSALCGNIVEVLVEESADEMGYVQKGRHEGQAPEVDGVTYLVSSNARPGELIQARIIQTGDFDIVAEQI